MRDSGRLIGDRTPKLAVIITFIAAYVALGAYFRFVLRTHVVYTHFAYVPIFLAGVWWGRKSIIVAGVLAGLVLVFRLVGVSYGELWSDLARAALLVGAAACVGVLGERVASARRSLEMSEKKYKLLIEESLAGIIAHREGRILFANPRFGEILGEDSERLVGKSLWELIHADDVQNMRRTIMGAEEDGAGDMRHECRMVNKDGRTVWMDVASSVAEYEGGPARLVYLYDISDRKDEEAKRRELSELAQHQEDQLVHSARLAELGEMAAAVAHELNQPLTGIKNFARNASFMISENTGNLNEVGDNLQLISEQVDRAATIINRMRGLARRTELELQLVDINQIVRDSVEFLRPQFTLSGVRIELKLAEDVPQIMGDKIRLEQVFLNILTNARQAMNEAPERRLTVTTHVGPRTELPIQVRISDTGKGFAACDAEKVFRPFYSTKKEGHGTGLGLSISLSIIKSHGGAIEPSGAPGKGATFTVMLPLRHGTGQEAS